MRLVRADVTNRAFDKLEAQWRSDSEQYGEDFRDFAAPYVNYARAIAGEDPIHPTYGIFLLQNDEKFECLSHCNVARLPRTSGETLRVNWVLLAPQYEYDETPSNSLVHIFVGLFRETIRLSRGDIIEDFRSEHIKLPRNATSLN